MIKDLWQILLTVANLTKDVDRAKREIEGLRENVTNLRLTVNKLQNDLEQAQVTTKLVLENYKSEIDHAKEGLTAKFDVLTTRLDLNIADFERRLPPQPRRKTLKALKKAPKR